MRPFSGRLELLNELTLWQDETERQVIEGSGDAPSRKEPE